MNASGLSVVRGQRRVRYVVQRPFNTYKAIAPFVDSQKREAYCVTGTGAGKTMALMHVCVGYALGEQGAAAELSGGEVGMVTIPGSEYWKLVLRPTLERYLAGCVVVAYDADTGDVIGRRAFAEIQTGARIGDYLFTEDPRNGAFGVHLFPRRWSASRGSPWGERTIWVKARTDSERMAGSNLAFVAHEEMGIVPRSTNMADVERCVNNANERVRVKGPGGDDGVQRIRGVMTPECGVGHFFYSGTYVPWSKGLRPDVDVVQFSTLRSPYRSLPTIRTQYEAYAKLPHLRDAKIKGQFVDKMEGKVLSNFDRVLSVEPYKYDSRASLYLSFDFNVTPHSTMLVFQPRLFAGAERAGLHLIAEYAMPGVDPTKYVRMCAAKYPQHSGEVHIFGDAAAWNHASDGFSYQAIAQTAETCFGGASGVRRRWNKKNAQLLPSVFRLNYYIDHPSLGRLIRLAPECQKTIDAMAAWNYDEQWKASNNPHKHFTDCMRYVVDKEFPSPNVAGLRDSDDADSGGYVRA